MSCSNAQTITSTSEGHVYCTGDNTFRQLGKYDTTENIIRKFTHLSFDQCVINVACGIGFSLFLTNESKVFAVGNNSTGNLGLGHKYASDIPLQVHSLRNIKVVSIEAGRHSAALSDLNELFLWGPAGDPSKPFLDPYEVKSDKKVA